MTETVETLLRQAAAIDRAVTQALARTGVPSAQVAVVRGGELLTVDVPALVRRHNQAAQRLVG